MKIKWNVFAFSVMAVLTILIILTGCPNQPETADTTAPGEVTNLRAISGDSSITVTWTEPADEDYAGVHIYYPEELTLTVKKGTTRGTITKLNNGTTYTIIVKTFDTTGNESKGSEFSSTPQATTSQIKEINFTAPVQGITLTNLKNQSAYLVKINTSSKQVDHEEAGGVAVSTKIKLEGPSFHDFSSRVISGTFGNVTRYDYLPAREFNSNPPAIDISGRSVSAARSASVSIDDTNLSIGSSTRDFWVDYKTSGLSTDGNSHYIVGKDPKGNQIIDNHDTDGTDGWIQLTATLHGQSDHANVWVVNNYYDNSSTSDTDSLITSAQAQKAADTFNAIYYPETNIFGYEYGGGVDSSDSTYGGRDGETRVNILISDIFFDATANQSTGYVGYFWGKDYYTNSELASLGYKSNESEIFYIDSQFTDAYPGVMYSTLAHEFQHMINFNEKSIKNGQSSSTWFNEMLSLVTEDMMAPYVETALGDEYDVDEDGPIQAWIPNFNYYYYGYGITDWDDEGYTYATAYAFGAYLTRNYGGAKLLQAVASNADVDQPSITAALTSLGYDETTFEDVFRRYGEALVYSSSTCSGGSVPDDLNTFDRTTTCTITDPDNGTGYDYTFSAFDPYTMANAGYGYEYYSGYACPKYGPTIIDTSLTASMPAYGLIVQSEDDWKDVTGDLTITLKKPEDDNIIMYLMVR